MTNESRDLVPIQVRVPADLKARVIAVAGPRGMSDWFERLAVSALEGPRPDSPADQEARDPSKPRVHDDEEIDRLHGMLQGKDDEIDAHVRNEIALTRERDALKEQLAHEPSRVSQAQLEARDAEIRSLKQQLADRPPAQGVQVIKHRVQKELKPCRGGKEHDWDGGMRCTRCGEYARDLRATDDADPFYPSDPAFEEEKKRIGPCPNCGEVRRVRMRRNKGGWWCDACDKAVVPF